MRGDVWCNLTRRVHGDVGRVSRGDIVWGKVVNVKGKNQLHSMVSDNLIRHRYVTTVLEALGFKDISQLGKYQTEVDKVSEKIESNPRKLTQKLKNYLKDWKNLFGCPGLRFTGSIEIPSIPNAIMVNFIVNALNHQISDKKGFNATASQFKDFGLDISPYTKEKLATMSKADQKRFRRNLVSKKDVSPLMCNAEFLDTMFSWIETNDLVAKIYSVCKTVDVMVTSKGVEYNVPSPFNWIVGMAAEHNSKSHVEVIRRLMAGPLTCSFQYPMYVKVQMGTVGEFILSIMSRLSSETRVAVQPVFQEKMKEMLLSLRSQSNFVSGDELTVGYDKCFAALKFLGMNSSSCGQDNLRSTTDMKDFVKSFVAQLSITCHQAHKLKSSFFGKMVMPFCLGSRTNSTEVLKMRASERIFGFIRMLRARKVFQMHLRSVARPVEHMVYVLKALRETEAKPVNIFKKPSDSQIFTKQVEFICSTYWKDQFDNIRTGYGASVSEMRERHRNRIAREDTGDFIGVCPDVPDLREFLFSKPAPVEEVSKPVETPMVSMKMTTFMKRELEAAKAKGVKIAAQQKAKRAKRIAEEEAYENELSFEDEQFYLKHMDLVNSKMGTLQQRIDQVWDELEAEKFGPVWSESEDDDYWYDEY